MRDELHPEAVRVYVRLVAEALHHISGTPQAEPDAVSGISLPTLRAVADALAEQIAQLMQRLQGRDPSAMAAARGHGASADEFALRLERKIAARWTSGEPSTPPAELIRAFVETHFAEHLTLDSVAAATGCTRSHVAAAFDANPGDAMHRYLARARIRRAAELIMQGDKIESAMLAVGYRSKKNFYYQFKRETGDTPAAYRAGARTLADEGWPPIVIEAATDAVERRTKTSGLAEERTPGASSGPVVPDRVASAPVTIARACELLGVSRRTVYNWIRQGRLQATVERNGSRRILLDSGSPAAGRRVSAAASPFRDDGRSREGQ
jgi:excisionase family DNA binding protein